MKSKKYRILVIGCLDINHQITFICTETLVINKEPHYINLVYYLYYSLFLLNISLLLYLRNYHSHL